MLIGNGEMAEMAMTAEQFDLSNQLFSAVYNVADSLGAEASEPAQLLLTSRKSLDSCKALFPISVSAEPLTEEQFKAASRDADSVAALLTLLPNATKTFGIFREDASSFWLCVFWNSTVNIGLNAFFRAHRVET